MPSITSSTALESDGRAFLLTAPGVSAIAVVRLVGPGAVTLLQRHFTAASALVPLKCVHGRLLDDSGATIDDPLVVLGPEARYADLSLHGGEWVVHQVMRLACESGINVIERADAPLHADSVDADTLLEQEMLQWLPMATTERATRWLLAQPTLWEDRLSREAASSDTPYWRSVLDDPAMSNLLRHPVVAIVGKPNVGKSTLANRLYGQRRSIEADLPGTTRDWVGELADVHGLSVMLVDTPGLRDSDDRIEQSAISLSRGIVRRAELTLLVLDASDETDDAALREAHPQAIVVANKCDLPGARSIPDAIRVTAARDEGIDALRDAIAAWFGLRSDDAPRACVWTDRQRRLLEQDLTDISALRRALFAPVSNAG
jgi:tRNA modification GTPase